MPRHSNKFKHFKQKQTLISFYTLKDLLISKKNIAIFLYENFESLNYGRLGAVTSLLSDLYTVTQGLLLGDTVV